MTRLLSTVRENLLGALTAANLPPVRIHDLGHTFAPLAVQQGVSIKRVQNALGHRSAKLTLDTYAHVTRDMRKEAAGAMGRRLPACEGAS